MALPNIWSICFFTGQTPRLKTPQGTLHFTFLPCTTRQVAEADPSYETFITIIIMLSFLYVLTNQFPSLNDQESCVRVLLYRGANKEAKNKHGQTPFQVNAMTLIPYCMYFVLGFQVKLHLQKEDNTTNQKIATITWLEQLYLMMIFVFAASHNVRSL